MRTFDWLVVVVMGVVGWLLVSFLLNRAKPLEDEEDAEFPTMPRLPGSIPSSRQASDLLSLDEIGRSWHLILGVPADASGAQIEAAYRARLAGGDEKERSRVTQAYEFIRPSRV